MEMGQEEEYDSDTSDDDYMPSDREAVSEEEESGDDEGIPGETSQNAANSDQKKIKKNASGAKRKKKSQGQPSCKRKGGIRLEDENSTADDTTSQADAPTEDYNEELGQQMQKEKQEKKQVEEKSKADALWADFMSDVGPSKPKPKSTSSGSGLGSLNSLTKPISSLKPTITNTSGSSPCSSHPQAAFKSRLPSKVTITKEYDFAGEVVKVTKEVDADSKEAKEQLKKQDVPESPKAGPSLPGIKKAGGGLGSVLGKIGGKQKMSTLEKSKLDWNSFKRDEGINEELQIHNRGKDGYLERMAFLDRTDVRQFEMERNLRLSKR